MPGDTDQLPRRALVLAGGGITGGLYEVGALLALDTLFDRFTACDFDVYVGTSAGAFVASLLANGVTPERLRETIETDRSTLPRLSGSQFLSIPWRSYGQGLLRAGLELPRVAHHLWSHWGDHLFLDSLGSLMRLLPQGLFSLDGIEGYVRTVLTRGGRTDEFHRLTHRLLIAATALDTGSVHVFGRPNDPTPISRAVAASAAVPVLFEPVRIGEVDYIDAAVSKTAHASLAIAEGARLVVLVNPIRPVVLEPHAESRLRDAGPLAIAGQALRIMLQRRLHDSVDRHRREQPDADLVLLEPYERDLALFDVPLMTYTLRQEVIRRGYRTTVKTILADYPRYVALFARHGITLAPHARIERRARRWSSASRRAAA